jgi:hypothetical protein
MDILFEEEGELKVVFFDATIRYVYTASSSITEHPVERGAALTDHSRPEVERISADVYVTDTPVVSPNYDGANGTFQNIDLSANRRDMTRGAKGGAGQPQEATYETKSVSTKARVLKFSEPFDRLVTVRETLMRIKDNALECSVITSEGDFDPMLIASITAPKESAGRIQFTVDLKKVTFADSEIVEVEPLETRAERERRLGARGGETPEEPEVSIAAALADIPIRAPRMRGGAPSR